MRRPTGHEVMVMAAVVTILTGAAAFLGRDGGSEEPRSPRDPVASATATPEDTVEPTPTPTPTPTPPPPPSLSLEKLLDDGNATLTQNSAREARKLRRTVHPDAISAFAYPGEGDVEILTITPDEGYARLKFEVGIDAQAFCRRARAEVLVIDEADRALWGPHTVSIREPRIETGEGVDISGAVQVILVHRSTGASDCHNGETEVTWGAIAISP